MAYNKMFLEALNNTEVLRNENEKKRNDALDDILKVDLTLNKKNIIEDTCYDSFRKAIFAHSTLWQSVDNRLLQENPPQQGGLGVLKTAFKFNPQTSTHYLSEEMQSHSFIMMQQKAAEQRVKFGLKLAGPEILINILKNNDDACRDYLAGKDLTNLGIKLAEVPAWTQDKKKVLTNDALEEIKREAMLNLKKKRHNMIVQAKIF
ncbi:MAG: hypothetical protein HYX60_08630 [Legionella longbeachae]|nr:hypothetical protein [Legionella longbeachae]